MRLTNTQDRYGLVAISLHWLVAIAIVGMYIVGWYMMTLDYYDPMYHTLPSIHKSIGMILVGVIFLRLLWRLGSTRPAALETHSRMERRIAHLTHIALYLLIMIVLFSGYLISTASGKPISVFGWFSVPALPVAMDNQADKAGFVHFWVATALLVLAGMHALAAFKHHLIDKDETLVRITKPGA